MIACGRLYLTNNLITEFWSYFILCALLFPACSMIRNLLLLLLLTNCFSTYPNDLCWALTLTPWNTYRLNVTVSFCLWVSIISKARRLIPQFSGKPLHACGKNYGTISMPMAFEHHVQQSITVIILWFVTKQYLMAQTNSHKNTV